MRHRLAHWLSRRLVDLASAVVPAAARHRFREEWRAELWHQARADDQGASSLLRRSAGALSDAAELRRLGGKENPGRVSMFWQDIRFAFRAFRNRPVWATIIVATLAVSIGANTAIFSLVNAVLLQPLDFPQPERLVKIVGSNVEEGILQNLSPADFYDLAAETRTMESMGAHGWVGFFSVTGNGEPERLGGTTVTAGFFRALGVRPALGRLFTEEDDRQQAPLTAVLTHPLWRNRFGSRHDVVGESIIIDAQPHEILGVLPEDYSHPEPNPEREPALYTLYRFDRADLCRDCRFIRAVGRLRGGRSVTEAQTEVEAIAARLERTYPQTNTRRGVAVVPLKEAIVGDARSGILVLFAAVGAVLLIACVNLANLQLVEGARRRSAFAIHRALGAGRWRVVRALVTESFILSAAGAGVGLVLAHQLTDLIALRTIPRAAHLPFDGWVFAFTGLLAAASSCAFGLVPAWLQSGNDPGGLSAEGGSRGSSARRGSRSGLIAAEIAIALVLLVAAGLFFRSFSVLRSVSPGFETDRILTMSLSLPTARYQKGEQIPFYDELYRRIEALPGVRSVGATNILPLTNNYSRDSFQIEDRSVSEGERPSAEARSVSAGYFPTLGIPLLRGRLFDERDRGGSSRVVVISETMSRLFWPDENPIGKRITYNRGIPDEAMSDIGGAGSREIVGIVGDVKHLGLEDDAVPMFYTPQPHDPSFHSMTLVVRTTLAPEVLARSVRTEVRRMDPEIPLYAVRTLDAVVEAAIATPRFRTTLVGTFAAVALGLAWIGVYSIVSLLVGQREREIGIRMALGARARDVVGMLVGESMRGVLVGIASGIVLSALLGRFVASLLFHVVPTDPLVYGGVSVLLCLSALAATMVPSLRASRIDPIHSLSAQ